MEGQTFFEALADEFELNFDVSDDDRKRIPTAGPVVVVANHPMGGIDGIALGALMASVRKDWRVLSHGWFDRFPELTRNMIVVNPDRKPGAANGSSRAIKSSAGWLKQGKMLVMFPAGTVSRFQWKRFNIVDSPWRSGVARLARLTGATVLPIHIDGRNSWLFQAASMIHPKLILLLLCRELLNKRGKAIRMQIGQPMPFEKIAGEDDGRVTSVLRNATYNLAR
jgi:putative hemolysin